MIPTRIVIEGETIEVTDADGQVTRLALGSPEGFALVSRLWLRSGWDTKYVYGFTWLGRPIIQLPEDLVRVQEVIYRVKPDVIIETGVAHGGSLVFYASLCHAMGRGRVVGVDVEIRPHNRQALAAHELTQYITLIEGSSIDPAVVDRVRAEVAPGATVFVMLDANHSRAHVRAELERYAPLVSVGSYVVVADGIMASLNGAPRTQPDWSWNNPLGAIDDFLRTRSDFAVEEPTWPFNEGQVTERVTYWPRAYLRRLR